MDTIDRIERTLDTLRPYIASHRGHVEVVDFDEGDGVLLLEAKVTAALARIRNPRLENDLLSAGMIRDLAVSQDGAVSFTFLLSPEDPATLVRQARTAVQELDGV